MPLPKDPAKREGWIHKQQENTKTLHQNSEYRSRYESGIRKREQNPEYIRNREEGIKTRSNTIEWRNGRRITALKLAQDPGWQDKQQTGAQKRSRNPEWQSNQIKGAQKRSINPDWRNNQKVGIRKTTQDPKWKLKHIEGLFGGFWYGNVKYNDSKYCELWCPDLWHRIDEAQNYQSILSGKTKLDNGGRALNRHHVYWQPKACCDWDEDVQGYYAMINVGNRKIPTYIKYYIKGDPNKFVLLTSQEHGMVSKNKLGWIKLFEELIEIKLGGTCYLPKSSSSK